MAAHQQRPCPSISGPELPNARTFHATLREGSRSSRRVARESSRWIDEVYGGTQSGPLTLKFVQLDDEGHAAASPTQDFVQ